MLYNDVFHVTIDTHANITLFTDFKEPISGYDPSEVIGKNWFKVFIPEDDFEEMMAVFDSFLKGNISFWEYQNRITSKNGSHYLLQWKNVLLRDPQNNPIAVSCQGKLAE